MGKARTQAVQALPGMLKCVYKSSIISNSSELDIENSYLGGMTGFVVWFRTGRLCGGIERTHTANNTKNKPINDSTEGRIFRHCCL
jgi:hypothetical protein